MIGKNEVRNMKEFCGSLLGLKKQLYPDGVLFNATWSEPLTATRIRHNRFYILEHKLNLKVWPDKKRVRGWLTFRFYSFVTEQLDSD